MKSLRSWLLLVIAALIAVVAGCTVASQDGGQTAASSGGRTPAAVTLSVSADPSAQVNPALSNR